MRPKILFILHLPPPVHGAAMVGKYILESEVINIDFNCRYINLGTSRSVGEVGKNTLKKWLRYFSILVKTVMTVIRFKPDLVYLTLTAKGSGFYKDALAALIVKGLGQKVVYHFHNKGVSFRQENAFDNLLYKKVFKNSDVILLSEHLYSDIQKYVNKLHVQFCPNGIPDLVINKQYKTSLTNNGVNILFLSNLIESKGVFILLEACKLLHKNGLDFHCTFAGGIGDVSEKQFYDKVHEFNLTNSVKYVGKKYGFDKEFEFLNADIFVLPTYNECFPLVLLEAMQFSLPIISTLEGGIPEIVEDRQTGFLVPKRDVNALVEKLELLINNKELRASMGIAARNKYEEKFTLGHFEKRLTSILKQNS